MSEKRSLEDKSKEKKEERIEGSVWLWILNIVGWWINLDRLYQYFINYVWFIDILSKLIVMRELQSGFTRDPPKFNCDGEFKKVPKPFPNSTFAMFVVGKPKAGKTSFVVDILCNKKRRVYYKNFDWVYLIQPELSRNSIKKDPFKSIPNEQKFENFDLETLNKLFDMVKENSLHEENSLIFLDDVASHLKSGGRPLEMMFQKFFFLKRHLRCSLITAVQRFSSLPKSIRAAQDVAVIFQPANRAERQIIIEEYLDLPRKTCHKMIEECYRENHDFIYTELGTNTYFRNMNQIEFDPDELNY